MGRHTSNAIAAAMILAAVAVSYHGALGNDFAWDDTYLVLDNPVISDISNIPDLFVKPWAGGVGYALGDAQNRPYFRPLALASMAADWAMAGPNPRVFHATNVAIHFLASLFVFFWLRKVLGRQWKNGSSKEAFHSFAWPLGLALVYAVHPVHTEAVNLVSYRTTLLSGMFLFAALLAMTPRPEHDDGSTGPFRATAGVLLFSLSLLSKETGLILPGLLLTHDLVLGRLDRRRLLGVYMPLVLVSAAYLLLREQVTGEGVYSFFEGLSPLETALMAPRIFFLYVRLCLFPNPLCPFYDWGILGVPRSFFEPDILAGSVVFTGMVVFMLLMRRRNPLATFGIAFFLVALLPVSHIVPFFDAAGERFLYVPLVGLLVGAAGIAVALPGTRALRSLGIASAVIVFTAFVGLTVVRTAEWSSSESALDAMTRDFPSSLSAHLGLGRLLIADERPGEAIGELKTVTKLAPKLAVGHGLLATAHALSGDLKAARHTIMKAPPPQPRLPSAAQVARNELAKRHRFDILHKMGL